MRLVCEVTSRVWSVEEEDSERHEGPTCRRNVKIVGQPSQASAPRSRATRCRKGGFASPVDGIDRYVLAVEI
jgi:hypothetical protein